MEEEGLESTEMYGDALEKLANEYSLMGNEKEEKKWREMHAKFKESTNGRNELSRDQEKTDQAMRMALKLPAL